MEDIPPGAWLTPVPGSAPVRKIRGWSRAGINWAGSLKWPKWPEPGHGFLIARVQLCTRATNVASQSNQPLLQELSSKVAALPITVIILSQKVSNQSLAFEDDFTNTKVSYRKCIVIVAWGMVWSGSGRASWWYFICGSKDWRMERYSILILNFLDGKFCSIDQLECWVCVRLCCKLERWDE